MLARSARASWSAPAGSCWGPSAAEMPGHCASAGRPAGPAGTRLSHPTVNAWKPGLCLKLMGCPGALQRLLFKELCVCMELRDSSTRTHFWTYWIEPSVPRPQQRKVLLGFARQTAWQGSLSSAYNNRQTEWPLPAHCQQIAADFAPRSRPICTRCELQVAVERLGCSPFLAPGAGAPVDRGPPHCRPAESGWPVQHGRPAAAGGLPAAGERSPGSCHAAASLQHHTWCLRRRTVTENDRPVTKWHLQCCSSTARTV